MPSVPRRERVIAVRVCSSSPGLYGTWYGTDDDEDEEGDETQGKGLSQRTRVVTRAYLSDRPVWQWTRVLNKHCEIGLQ